MKKILMCSPDHYCVTYQINPWMNTNCSINKDLAMRQWKNLKYLIENFFELEAVTIKQKSGLPDMVFSADQGLIIGSKFIQANFAYKQREKETRFYGTWFRNNGYEIIKLPKKLKFEGGDFLLWGNKVLAGYGFRTGKDSHKEIENITCRKVISLKLVDPFLYHLDLVIFPLDAKTLVYYPDAFSQSSQKTIKDLGKRLIEVSRKDALNLTLNSIVHGKKIITKQGINGLLVQLIKEDFKVIQTDVSEFKKAGGGIHCLTCYLN